MRNPGPEVAKNLQQTMQRIAFAVGKRIATGDGLSATGVQVGSPGLGILGQGRDHSSFLKTCNGRKAGYQDMKIRNCALIPALLALVSLSSFAQNNCSASPPTGTCPAPAPPFQAWCAGNNSQSTCPGGTSHIGFSTSSPQAGSWTKSFAGLDAVTIAGIPGLPRSQPDPNGGVGPTNGGGVGQYLQFAGGYVQAFDRKTGNGIFSKQANSGASPQALTTLFSPGGKNYCASASLDGIATYDRIDGVFVLANIFNPGGAGTYYYCIGVSASAGGVPANNLQGSGGQSYWNTYAYNLNPAIPINPNNGKPYFPDYARFGTWSDGFYVSFDLEDQAQNFNIVGFEVCKFDKANIIAGLSSNPPVCYTYIPSYVTPAKDISLIHSPLPADFEGGNPIPGNTAGEYFLAQVNPSNPGTNDQCTQLPCTSNQLAFWTWSGFTSGAGPTFIPLNAPFTPGCYNTDHPFNTVCIQQPYGGFSDSVGDRLMHRLAYRYLTVGPVRGEYLAVAHTVQENAGTQRTGIHYYVIAAGSNPTIALKGDLQDTTYHYFVSLPSVAMDKNGNLGVTLTVTGNTSSGSAFNYDPSPFFLTVGNSGRAGQPVPILTNSGNSGQDETDGFWGEYVSVSSDPSDDLTFWATNEYMKGDQVSNCVGTNISGCKWATRVFVCKKGSGC